MRKTLRILLPCALFLATFLTFSGAKAAVFYNWQTGACLDDKFGSTANSNPLWAYPCNATFAQQWNFEGLEIQGIGLKCVDVQNAGTADGTLVQLYACNGTGAQRWYYYNYQIVNLNAFKCLDANGGQPHQLVIRSCNGSLSQRWMIRS